jgi:siroheme decarboxylase
MSATALSPTEFLLADRWQRGFPIMARPFAIVARSAGLDERSTIDAFARLLRTGALSRIGAVVRPNTIGASLLAAMRVPASAIEAVAAIVSAEPLVNHNYQREHEFNLWFVIAGPDAAEVADAVEQIERRTGHEALKLPLERAYHLDLGFGLSSRDHDRRRGPSGAPCSGFDARDRALLGSLQDGLPLVARPFRQVARAVGFDELEVIGRLAALVHIGVVTRFGCVVRHRFFGYAANAMAVWDIPDGEVDGVAARFAVHPRVTLCYRRPRQSPLWPYNLFCMVHAKDRGSALGAVHELNRAAGTIEYPQAVLFSTRCFKQRGAIFSESAAVH